MLGRIAPTHSNGEQIVLLVAPHAAEILRDSRDIHLDIDNLEPKRRTLPFHGANRIDDQGTQLELAIVNTTKKRGGLFLSVTGTNSTDLNLSGEASSPSKHFQARGGTSRTLTTVALSQSSACSECGVLQLDTQKILQKIGPQTST
jgi:hypothetical protein